MKFFVATIFLTLLSPPAFAGTAECKAITDPRARLACYDREATATPAQPSPRSASGSKVDSGKYVDSISAEDAIVNARLKNICRGC